MSYDNLSIKHVMDKAKHRKMYSLGDTADNAHEAVEKLKYDHKVHNTIMKEHQRPEWKEK